MSLRASSSRLPKGPVHKAAKRAISSTACRHSEKPILNRYSRNVTKTKDQGASQVRSDALPIHQCVKPFVFT